MKVIRSKLFREARNLGFVHTKRMRNVLKGKVTEDVYIFAQTHGNRKLTLEIYLNGNGCVHHSVISGGWSAATTVAVANAALPTEFKDLAGMYRAIAFEWTRKTTEAKLPEVSAPVADAPKAW